MENGSRFAIGAFAGLVVGLFLAFLLTSQLSWFAAVVAGSVLLCGFMTMLYGEWFLKLLSLAF